MEFDLTFILVGAVTGFIIGLTGVGGGAIMTPLLMLVFGLNPITAVATDLWFAAITKLSAVSAYNKYKEIQWPIVYHLWMGSIPSVLFVITGFYLGYFSRIENYLPQIIGIMILITSFGFIFSKKFNKKRRKEKKIQPLELTNTQKTLTVITGIILGTAVSLTSVGAGALGTISLFYLYPRNLTPYMLISTEVTHAIPLAFIAGLGYLFMGEVDLSLLANLLIGSIWAAWLGATCAKKVPDKALKLCLFFVLSFVAYKLLRF